VAYDLRSDGGAVSGNGGGVAPAYPSPMTEKEWEAWMVEVKKINSQPAMPPKGRPRYRLKVKSVS